jgi:hypothetical protein
VSDYQKVEVVREEEAPAPFSEQDIQNLEQETQEEVQALEPSEERPPWLPEKFESPEEFAKAYQELESNFTRSRQEQKSGEEGTEETNAVSQPISHESLKEFSEEFAMNGDVSEESRQKIVEMGLPREFVDAYVEGQKAVLSNHMNNIFNEVGGEESYKQMTAWAAEHLPEGDQEAFNNAVTKGSTEDMMFAIRSLNARYRSEADVPTPLIQGDTGSAPTGGSFRSLAELTSAMKDPRYTKDPAYRQDIENRLNNSNIL